MVAAPAEEVTGAAVVAARQAHGLRDRLEVGRLPHRPGLRRELPRLVGRVSRTCGELPVLAGRVVTDKAVDVLGLAEIERRILPAISRMAAGAARLVRRQRDAEVVDRVDLVELDFTSAVDLLT